MGRPRAKIPESNIRWEGHQGCVYFRHPIRKRVVWFSLGVDRETAKNALEELNRIFLTEAHWRARPDKISDEVWRAWAGEELDGDEVDAERGLDHPEVMPADPATQAVIFAQRWREERKWREHFEGKCKRMKREIEHLRGRKYRSGPSPSLRDAVDAYIDGYKNRDADHMRNVKSMLNIFVKRFGDATPLDDLDGKESKIEEWLRSLVQTHNRKKDDSAPKVPPKAISPGRRNQIRGTVLRFLDSSGLKLDRALVAAAGAKEVRARRGPVRWLQDDWAAALIKHLPPFDTILNNAKTGKLERQVVDANFWQDIFRVQVGLGLRPEELITLKAADFAQQQKDGRRTLTLSPLGALTLKTGSRTIVVPEIVWEIVERRQKSAAVFANPITGKPWLTPAWFHRSFVKALRAGAAASAAAGVPIGVTLDARIGRRTCASRLINAGVPVEDVAKMLGDEPDTIREHYGALLPERLDPSKAAI